MKLIIVNGTMGSGKTTTCQILKNKLDNAVFLDGDWCWDMHPFTVNDKTKTLVMKNIWDMLNNFIEWKCFDYIIFCWVIHEENILNDVIKGLNIDNKDITKVSLICDEDALRKRILIDINNGIRTEDVLKRSIERIPLYKKMSTNKIDVSNISSYEAADNLLKLIKN